MNDVTCLLNLNNHSDGVGRYSGMCIDSLLCEVIYYAAVNMTFTTRSALMLIRLSHRSMCGTGVQKCVILDGAETYLQCWEELRNDVLCQKYI
jgi:hypothetical protein